MYDEWYPDKDDEYWDQLAADIERADYNQAMDEIDEREGPPSDYDDGDEIPLQPPKQPNNSKQFFDDDDERIRDWDELDSEPDRVELIPDWLFSAGVTGLVGEPGYGKTTLAVSIAMTVNSVGGMWAGDPVKEPRPVLWIVGDDKFSLKLVRKTWLQEHPNAKLVKGGGWIKRPLDFGDETTVRKLIKKLKVRKLMGLPPMMIVLDLVSDMYGDRDDEKGKDVTKVYKHIWWVVAETGATFLCLQLPPWGARRPKGSINIKGKNDIVLFVNEMEPDAGYMKLEHQKRREGREVEMTLEVKLVPVAGKPQPVPIVTGRLWDAMGAAGPPKSSRPEDDLEFIVATLKVVLGNRATTVELLAKVQELKTGQKGWGETSFYDRLKILRDRGRVVGGGGKGEYIWVVEIQPEKPEEGVRNTSLRSDHSAPKGGGAERSDLYDSASLRNNSGRSDRSDEIQGRTEGHSTREDGVSVPSGEDLIAKATAHARAAPDPTVQAAADRAQARSDATKTKMK
jgi:hypothetical protein